MLVLLFLRSFASDSLIFMAYFLLKAALLIFAGEGAVYFLEFIVTDTLLFEFEICSELFTLV